MSSSITKMVRAPLLPSNVDCKVTRTQSGIENTAEWGINEAISTK